MWYVAPAPGTEYNLAVLGGGQVHKATDSAGNPLWRSQSQAGTESNKGGADSASGSSEQSSSSEKKTQKTTATTPQLPKAGSWSNFKPYRVGDISNVDMDPSGTPCSRNRICNNNRYEGICESGTCRAISREKCSDQLRKMHRPVCERFSSGVAALFSQRIQTDCIANEDLEKEIKQWVDYHDKTDPSGDELGKFLSESGILEKIMAYRPVTHQGVPARTLPSAEPQIMKVCVTREDV